jgi:hypothetical protein
MNKRLYPPGWPPIPSRRTYHRSSKGGIRAWHHNRRSAVNKRQLQLRALSVIPVISRLLEPVPPLPHMAIGAGLGADGVPTDPNYRRRFRVLCKRALVMGRDHLGASRAVGGSLSAELLYESQMTLVRRSANDLAPDRQCNEFHLV